MKKKTKIIAELELDYSLALIDKCVEAGVDAIKYQWYEGSDFSTPGTEIFEKYQNRSKFLIDLITARNRAQAKGLEVGISLFSIETVEQFAKTWRGFDFYKVAAPEALDLELIEELIKFGKQVYVSVGNDTPSEHIEHLWDTYDEEKVFLLWCETGYPVNSVDCPSNFEGISDHSAWVHGWSETHNSIEVIEKHVGYGGEPWVVHPEWLNLFIKQIRHGLENDPIKYVRTWKDGHYVRVLNDGTEEWYVKEPKQLELFEKVPEEVPAEPVEMVVGSAMLDRHLKALLEDGFTIEQIENALERMEKGEGEGD